MKCGCRTIVVTAHGTRPPGTQALVGSDTVTSMSWESHTAESKLGLLTVHDNGVRSDLFQIVLFRTGQVCEKQVLAGIAPLEDVRSIVVGNARGVEEHALIEPAAIGGADMSVLLRRGLVGARPLGHGQFECPAVGVVDGVATDEHVAADTAHQVVAALTADEDGKARTGVEFVTALAADEDAGAAAGIDVVIAAAAE